MLFHCYTYVYMLGRWGDARLFDDVSTVPPLTSPSTTTTATGAIEGGGGGGGGSKEHRLAMWGKCVYTIVQWYLCIGKTHLCIHLYIRIRFHAYACIDMLIYLCMLPPSMHDLFF